MSLKLNESSVRRNQDHDADCVMVTRLIHCPRKIPPINMIKAERILSHVDVMVDENLARTLGIPIRYLENLRASRSHIRGQIGKAKRDCVCRQNINTQADQSRQNVKAPPAKRVEEGSEFKVEISPQQNTDDFGDATGDVDAAASDDLNDGPEVSAGGSAAARVLFHAMMKGQHLGQWPGGMMPHLESTKFLKMSFAVNMLGKNRDRNLLECRESVEQKLEDTNPLWKQEVDTFSQPGFDWNAYKKGIIKEIKDSRDSNQ